MQDAPELTLVQNSAPKAPAPAPEPSVSAATASAQREDGTVVTERRVKSAKMGIYIGKRPKHSAINVRSELDRISSELRPK